MWGLAIPPFRCGLTIRATRMLPSRCGCAPGRPPTPISISPSGSTGGATRWRSELVPTAEIVVAEAAGDVIGFVTVDPRTRYLDQIVVAPESWSSGVGAALIAKAKQISPAGLDLDVNTDNSRAIRFYERNGFLIAGAGVNAISGKPVHRMRWRP